MYTVPMSWDNEGGKRPRLAYEQQGFDLIGASIRQRRRVLGLSQADVERMTGIDQSTLSRLENGRRFGLRWRRFATLVATLGGLDFGVLRGRNVMGLDHQRVPFPHRPHPPGVINTRRRQVDAERIASDALRAHLGLDVDLHPDLGFDPDRHGDDIEGDP